MPEYQKLKNAELEALLKDRGLPHSGKKAELVARLQEDDNKKPENPTATQPDSTKPSTAEDEIDWDDEAAPAPTDTKTVQPTIEPIATTTTETVATAETTNSTAQPTEPVEKEKTPVDFSIGLEAISLDEEIEKRKARARKFGIEENDPLADEALRRLERAKKFGEQAGPRGLNEALPDRRPKRGRDGQDERGDSKRRGGGGGRGGRRFNNDDRRRPQTQSSRPNTNQSNGGPSWMTDADRSAAEARKAKFAT